MSNKKNVQLQGNTGESKEPQKEPSLTALILWNISKVLERYPCIDLESALKDAQERLATEVLDVGVMMSEDPKHRHLTCALLAWQKLGHTDAASLFQFVDLKRSIMKKCCSVQTQRDLAELQSSAIRIKGKSLMNTRESSSLKQTGCSSWASGSLIGPVVKLPMQTKIVMHTSNTLRPNLKKDVSSSNRDKIADKIEEACCMDTSCAEKLREIDTGTKELRLRAVKLAKRDAERIELLERAEAAWRDLEKGFERRLKNTMAKEQDTIKEIDKMIAERNSYKDACTKLVEELKTKGNAAAAEQNEMAEIDKEVYDRAAKRMRLCEEKNKVDLNLSDAHSRATQLDRDLQVKEDQARRKVQSAKGDLDTARNMTCESERALRQELGKFKTQIEDISRQLLAEDSANKENRFKQEALREEKIKMAETVEGCKQSCDSKIRDKMNELKKLRDHMREMRDKVIDCQCKLPVDAQVEIKRTPSFAALCSCSPGDKIKRSCSCTSLRSQMLSNMFSDLFGGLQSEMGNCSARMPCQLLKCMEDKHSWDKGNAVRNNLRTYFSNLLIGELDIAIATAIEKYHAKWVGATCADVSRPIPDVTPEERNDWQEKVMEQRAQKLATKLAEQLFEERADKLTERAKQIVKESNTCECQQRAAITDQARQEYLDEKADMLRKKEIELAEAGAIVPCECCKSKTAVFHCMIPAPNIKDSTKKVSTRNFNLSNCLHMQTPQSRNTMKRKTVNFSSKNPTNVGTKHVGNVTKYAAKRNTNVFNQSSNFIHSKWNTQHTTDFKTNNGHVDAVSGTNSPDDYLQRTLQDVTQLRMQIADLKKESLKKKDLMVMEKKITKIVQQATGTTQYYGNKEDTIIINNSKADIRSQHLDQIRNYKIKASNRSVDDQSTLKKNPKNIKKTAYLLDKPPIKSLRKQSYAVNVCFCGSQREPNRMCQDDKLYQENKIKDPNESNPRVSNRNPATSISKDMLFQLTRSIKHNKPLAELGSNECNYFARSRSSTFANRNCSSDRACFHKLPSNSSIDNLLISLNKWKNQISCLEQENNVSILDSINNKLEGNTNLDHNENYGYIKKMESKPIPSNDMNNMEIHGVKSKQGIEKVCKSTDFGQRAVITESVYLGAINLEKSGENICNQDVNINIDLGQSKYKKLFDSIDNKTDNEIPIFYSSEQLETESKNVDTNELNTQTYSNFLGKKSFASDIKNIVKNSDVMSCDRGYDIKFLGVTLANTNSKKKDEIIVTPKIEDQTLCGEEVKKYSKRKNSTQWQDSDVISDLLPDSYTDKRVKDITYARLPCDCTLQIDEIKSFVNDVIHQQLGGKKNNQDESLDTDSLKHNTFTNDTCICCDSYPEDSKDLEFNTFDMLEQYLKNKLAEFKVSNCKASCLSKDDEQKMYTTIIHRVKDMISELSHNVQCKCADENKGDGSWNRAYELLQEYLKVKLKRVQCLCTAPSQNANVLSDVMEKVSNLIEVDFQRLHEICKCNKSNDLEDKKITKVTFEVPEKDLINNSSKDLSYCNTMIKNDCETGKNILEFSGTDNAIIKAIPFIKYAASCDALDIQKQRKDIEESQYTSCDPIVSKNIQKIITIIDMKEMKSEKNLKGYYSKDAPIVEHFHSNNIINSRYTECVDELNSMTPQVEFIDVDKLDNLTNDVKNTDFEQSDNNLREKEEKAIGEVTNSSATCKIKPVVLPYVGYTLDCICDNKLGRCICTRSQIKEKTEEIKNVWKMVAENVGKKTENSYIMQNVHNNLINYGYNDELNYYLKSAIEPNSKCENYMKCLSDATSTANVSIQSNDQSNKTCMATNTFLDITASIDLDNSIFNEPVPKTRNTHNV